MFFSCVFVCIESKCVNNINISSSSQLEKMKNLRFNPFCLFFVHLICMKNRHSTHPFVQRRLCYLKRLSSVALTTATTFRRVSTFIWPTDISPGDDELGGRKKRCRKLLLMPGVFCCLCSCFNGSMRVEKWKLGIEGIYLRDEYGRWLKFWKKLERDEAIAIRKNSFAEFRNETFLSSITDRIFSSRILLMAPIIWNMNGHPLFSMLERVGSVVCVR